MCAHNLPRRGALKLGAAVVAHHLFARTTHASGAEDPPSPLPRSPSPPALLAGLSVDIDQYSRYYLSPSDQQPGNGAIKVTYLGTTTLLFDDGETQLMIDGFFSRPALLKVTTSRIQTDTAVVDAALSRAGADRLKALFVAHTHYDHAFDAAHVAKRTGAKLHGSASTLNVGRGGGLAEDQLALYEPGRELAFGQFVVTVLSSRHSPPTPVNDDLGQVVDQPLRQPARARDYKEGGSFDMLIRHGDHSILVKPSANYLEGALDNVRAAVLFLGTGTLGNRDEAFRNAYYDQTVGKVQPRLVVPIHWDNFFQPLSDHLEAPTKVVDDLPAGFDFLIGRLSADGIQFGILQGFRSVVLFGNAGLGAA